ncbi:MAG: YnfA family protein [Dehalococcoidia bacterium]
MLILKSALLFLFAGLLEVGGGYLVWLWLREHRAFLVGVAGLLALALYGVVPTLQPAHFGRVYAAYGGVFIVLALLWGWGIDKRKPDAFDLLGGSLALAGAAVIMWWPRG